MESVEQLTTGAGDEEHQPPVSVGIKRALVVLNPVAGQSSPEQVADALDRALIASGWDYRIHELEKDELPERLDRQLRAARQQETSVIIAAGGDGTVSHVADAILRTGLADELFLGILPGGTANLLAGELEIPDDLYEAAALIAGETSCATIDAMRVGGKHYFLRIGVGIDAITIRDTTREAKRWFGKLAYAATFLRTLVGYGGHRFTIELDDRRFSLRAWQATVANGGFVGMKPLRLGPNISPSDGQLDLCVYAVRRWSDLPRILLRFIWRRFDVPETMRFFPVRRRIMIQSKRPLAVQADGEPIGETPVTIDLVPKAVRILRPCGPPARET